MRRHQLGQPLGEDAAGALGVAAVEPAHAQADPDPAPERGKVGGLAPTTPVHGPARLPAAGAASGQQLPGFVPCAAMLRRSGASGVICSTRQPGIGRKSVMASAMGSRTSTGHYRSAPVTNHAKCGRPMRAGQHHQHLGPATLTSPGTRRVQPGLAALAHGRAPGDRGGRGRPCA